MVIKSSLVFSDDFSLFSSFIGSTLIIDYIFYRMAYALLKCLEKNNTIRECVVPSHWIEGDKMWWPKYSARQQAIDMTPLMKTWPSYKVMEIKKYNGKQIVILLNKACCLQRNYFNRINFHEIYFATEHFEKLLFDLILKMNFKILNFILTT